jgi:predicted HTH domain antitoxin
MEQTATHEMRQTMAIGLFADGTISLAKAADMAGLTRYDFAKLLKCQGLPAYEYTRADYQEDLTLIAMVKK